MTYKPDDYIRRRVVCIGALTLEGGKPGIGFRKLDLGETLGQSYAFPRKGSSARVGCIYTIPESPDGAKWRFAGLEFVGPYGDRETALMWKVREEALLLSERAARRRKSGEAEALAGMLKGLEPLRIAYHTTDRVGKLHIDALALEYIHSYRLGK